jgi:YVTN family beta-propeller protein
LNTRKSIIIFLIGALCLSFCLCLFPVDKVDATTVTVGTHPYNVAVTPNGLYAYVTNYGAASVSVISTASNTVTATVPVGTSPLGVAVTPNGLYAYVTNLGDASVSVISTASNTVTATVPVGASPLGVAVTPNGLYAYVTNGGGASVSVISTASNTVTATVPVGASPGGVAVTPSGLYAYVTNGGGASVSVISTASNTVTATVPVGASPGGVAVTPNGLYAYVTNYDGASVSVISTASNTVTATITVGATPGGVAVTPSGLYAYVTNGGGASVSVISTASNTVTATVPVGNGPLGVAVTPNGLYAYVANGGGASVSVISIFTSNTVKATVPVGGQPHGVAVTPNGLYAYVTNLGDGSVSVISTASNTVTATVPVGASPFGVAVTPNGLYAYVANGGGASVSVISTASNTVTATVPVGATPRGVAVTPSGLYAYVTNYDGNSVSVISTASNTVTATVPVGASPFGVAVTPNGLYAYVTNYGAASVSVISTASNTVTATVPVGASPRGVAVTPSGLYAYVANGGGASVSVISTASNTVTATVPVGASPFGVAVTPNGLYAYVANLGDGSVSVISTASNTVTATITVGAQPFGVAVTPNGAYAYVTNNGDNSVSVINLLESAYVPALTLSIPTSTTVGTSESLSVTISGASTTPTGSATFQVKIGAGSWTTIGSAVTLSSGSASTTYTPLTADSYQFQVIYSGDTNYNGATGAASSLTVNAGSASVPAPTLSIPTSTTVGTSESLSVTISGTGTTPTGSATFQVKIGAGGWTTIGSAVTLSSGSASTTYTPLTAGSYQLQVIYSGDTSYNTATSAASSLTVAAGSASVPAPTLSIPTSTTVGTSESLSVTISGTGTTPTGSATFQVKIGAGGWTTIGSAVTLSSGSASTTYTPLTAGSYQFQVIYGGDTNYNGVTGSAASLTVNKGTPTVPAPTLSIPTSTTVGTSESLSVTISGTGTTPTGSATFQFKIGAGGWTTIGSAVTLSSGSASTTYTPLTAGSYQFQVIYGGDTNYNGVTGSAASLTVNKGTPTVPALTLSIPTSTTVGTSESLSVTISGLGAVPSGSATFQFKIGAGGWTTIGSAVTLSSGSASTTYTPLTAGSYQLQVIYSGDTSYNTATSAASSLTVAAGSASVPAPTLSIPTSTTVGTSESLSVTISGTGTTPTGSATFQVKIGAGGWTTIGSAVTLSSGSASTTYTPLTAGSYQFQVIYGGDTNYNGVTGSAASLTVNKGTPTVPALTLSIPTSTTVGTSESLSVTISGTGTTPTGSATFQFKIGAGGWTTIGSAVTLSSGSASTTYTPLTADSYQFQVIYGGDTNYNGVTGSAASLTVNKGTPTVPALTLSIPTSTTVGTSESLSVTISGLGAVPSGSATFQFKIGAGGWTTIGSAVTLSSGSASTTYIPLMAGSYQFQVIYSGDTNYNGATGTFSSLTVNAGSASVPAPTLSIPTSTTVGTSESLSVTVSGTGTTPTGTATFQFKIGAGGWTTIGSAVTLSSGSASTTYIPLMAGSYQFQVIYSGDTNYNTATSTASSLTVNPGSATYFVVSGFPSSTVAGIAHTVTVTAYDAYGDVATGYLGTVAVSSSDSQAGLPANAGLSSGVGSFTVTLNTAGSQSITATDTVTTSITGSQTGITVTHTSAVSIAVSPSSASITAEASQAFTAAAQDAYGNTWDVTNSVTWSINSGAGGSWSGAAYTSANAGSWTVTASLGGVFGTASLTVNAITYQITVTSAQGSPTASALVDKGNSFTASVTSPQSAGAGHQWICTGYSIDGATAISGTSYTFNNVQSTHTITFNWQEQYQVTFALSPSGTGSTSPVGSNIWENAGVISITATPNTGHFFSTWSSDTGSITFDNANSASATATVGGTGTITATFSINQYTVTVTQTANGIIAPGTSSANYGDTPTFSITPNTGYHIASIVANGSPVTVTSPAAQSYQFSPISASASLTATFAINTYTLTVNVGANGQSNIASQTVNWGSTENFVFTPNAGYSVSDVIVNGTVDEGAVASLSLIVTGSTSVNVVFAINTYTLTVNVGANGQSNIASQTVNWGSTENFVFTPNAGYSVSDVIVNGTVDEGAVASLSLIVTGSTSVNVVFAINTYTLTVNVGANGQSNIASQTVNWGSTENFVFTPNAGYSVSDVIVNGTVDEGAVASLSLIVTGSTSVNVVFAINTYTLTVNVGANGQSNIASQTVNWGSTENFVFTPNAGYSVSDVIVNGTVDEGAVASLSLIVTGSTSVNVVFAINTYTLTVNVGANGQSNIASQTVNWGSTENFVFTPNAGYSVSDVIVNGTVDEGAVASLSLIVTGSTSVNVVFAINTYTLTVNVGANGQSNIASQTVNWGSTENFVFTPNAGYSVSDVIVNGTVDEGAVASLSLIVTGSTSVNVVFAINTYTLTVNVGANGQSNIASQTVNWGSTENFVFTPNAGYSVSDVIVNGTVDEGAVASLSLIVTGSTSVNVVFAINTYTLTVNVGANGQSNIASQTVNWGSTENFVFTPNAGYSVSDVIVNGTVDEGAVASLSLIVTGSTSVNVVFAINTYTLTVNVGANGQSNIASQTVNWGSTENFVFTPNAGYSVSDVIVNGTVDEGAVASLSLIVTGSTSVNVVFAINTYTLTVNVGANGQSNIASQTVNWGSTENFVFTPNAGYSVSDVIVNGTVDEGAVASLSLIVTGSTSVNVVFAINTYTLTVNVGANGQSNIASQTVNWGSTENFVFTPNAGYSVSDVIVNGTVDEGAVASLSLIVTGSTSVNVVFAINTYTLTITQTANGVISPGSSSVNYGDTPTFSITPNVGYHIVSIYASGQLVAVTNSAGQNYQFSAISSDSSLSATYAINTYRLTVTQTANGAISPGTSTANYGDIQSFTITPNVGYHIASITVNGYAVTVASPLGQTYPFSAVSADSSLTATFAINTFTITVTQGANGQIAPATANVNYGDNQVFTITPDTGYYLASLTVDGSPVTVASLYTFSNVDASHTITATFAATATPTPTPVPTPTPTPTFVQATTENGGTVDLPISGNITSPQISNVTITTSQSVKTTTVSFTVTGESGTTGFSNITIPISEIPYGTTPTVYIDAQSASNQGFTQDSSKYYVWYTTHFSTHQITIVYSWAILQVAISGNITSSKITTGKIPAAELISTKNSTTTITFHISWENGTTGFSNITISKSEVSYGTIPTIYLDHTQAPDQGYTQDANNYYVWCTTPLNMDEISETASIMFVTPSQSPTASPNQPKSPFQALPVDAIYGLVAVAVAVAVVAVLMSPKIGLSKKLKQKVEKLHKVAIRLHSFLTKLEVKEV